MAQIHNSELSKELQEGAKLQIRDLMPTQIAEKVVPTMEVNPKMLRRSTIIGNLIGRATTASGLTITGLGARPNQDVYITGLHVTNVQDATSDNTVMNISGTFDGASKTIYSRRKPTTTASVTRDDIHFTIPLKIDRNSLVTYTCTFTAGASTSDVIIFGYIVDNVNA